MRTILRQYDNILFILVMCICLLAIAISLTGCYGPKKAERQVVKAYSTEKPVVDRLVAAWYNPVERVRDSIIYKPGRIYYQRDTVLADCDTVLQDPVTKTRLVRIACPPCAYSVDTVTYYQQRDLVNTATVQLQQHEMEQKTLDLHKTQAQLAAATTQAKAWRLRFWLAIAIAGGLAALRYGLPLLLRNFT